MSLAFAIPVNSMKKLSMPSSKPTKLTPSMPVLTIMSGTRLRPVPRRRQPNVELTNKPRESASKKKDKQKWLKSARKENAFRLKERKSRSKKPLKERYAWPKKLRKKLPELQRPPKRKL